MMNRIIDIWHNTRELVGLLTAERAGNLDRLDALVSSRLSALAGDSILARLSTIGYQCAIFDTPGPFSITMPSGVSLVYVSGCAAGSGAARANTTYGGGGGGAGILKLPLIVASNKIISGVIGQRGTNVSNTATTEGTTATGVAGTTTTINGLVIPVGGAGKAQYSSTSNGNYASGGEGGSWGQANLFQRFNGETYSTSTSTASHASCKQHSRYQEYFCEGGDGGIGSFVTPTTAGFSFLNGSVAGLGGVCPLLGIASALSATLARNGCGGSITGTSSNQNIPPGDGLILLEWFGVPAS
ncbi:MAG: hypothetical protein FWF41_05560 [Betaproteobacteria bacterium]|nr:hypothetical protein [Betaproteobacteria bacterium]